MLVLVLCVHIISVFFNLNKSDVTFYRYWSDYHLFYIKILYHIVLYSVLLFFFTNCY